MRSALLISMIAALASAGCGKSATHGEFAEEAGAPVGNFDAGDETGGCIGAACPSQGGDAGSTPGLVGDASPFTGDAGAVTVTDAGGVSVLSINGCPGSLGASTASALKAGGAVSSGMKWLYPYDGTVFPGGILPPILQWAQSAAPDAVYVHMSSKTFDYQGCFAGSNPPQLAVLDAVWTNAFAQSGGASDPLTVELTTSSGGTVSGPIREKWTLALGSLKGIVYYNTYTSQLAGNNGAVMSIAAGAAQPSVLLSITGVYPVGPCISCHSVSADGLTIVAQRHSYLNLSPTKNDGGDFGALLDSESYDLSNGVLPDAGAPMAKVLTDDWGLGALYPNGSRLLTDGQPNMTLNGLPAAAGNNPGMIGNLPSTMYDPRTGNTIASSGLTGKHAMMPMFSPDGTKIVFNDYDNGSGHTLVVMDFDPMTNVFSNGKVVFKDSTNYPAWPFFTPDSKSVVFVVGNSTEYATTLTVPVQDVATGDLSIVDLATDTAHTLDGANGYAGASSQLPYPGRDEHLNFYTTVSPVAAGGYFWVYFTSRRNYGNTLVKDATDPSTKKIWVSAVTIGAPAGQDPSHPAFYLPGQELGSGNIRAFATLEPCKKDGAGTCQTGIDCCGGFCTNGTCGKPPPPPPGQPMCSKLDERCMTAADCCDKTQECISGFCAQVIQ